MTKNSEEIKIETETLSATLSGMENILNINPLLEKACRFMESTDEGTRETLRETLSVTAQRKLARYYTDHMQSNINIPLSLPFQEKLTVYWLLSPPFEEDESDDGAENAVAAEKAPTSSVKALVEMQAQTKAAIKNSKEGALFDCLARLQAAQASPQTRSAANCCLRHLERSLRKQILTKGNKLGLYRNAAIHPWYELDESLKGESCRRYPKEYFKFFRYCPEKQAFSFDSAAFDRATRPF